MSYGFLGAGRMARAIIDGLLRAKFCSPEKIIVSGRTAEKLTALAQETGVRIAKDNPTLAREAEWVILAVKPWDVEEALKSCAGGLANKLLISVVTGKSTTTLQALSQARIARTMPNTGAMVGVSTTAVAGGPTATAADIDQTRRIFETVGSVFEIKEALFDAVAGVSGSGPAYIYLVIEALSDGGVAAGLPRILALDLAIQTVRGAAIMAKQTGLHPALLREMITSPGGTTAAALGVLEDASMRAAFIRAIQAAQRRSAELGAGS